MRIAMLVGAVVVAMGLSAQATTLELITEDEAQDGVIVHVAAVSLIQDIQLGTPITGNDATARGISCEPNCLLPGYYFPPPDLPPVPEPTAFALLGLGLAGLGLMRRR